MNDNRFPRCGAVTRLCCPRILNTDHDDEENTMSLPRSDYDPRRVCLNPFPFLEKINLGKHRRTIGVYIAGGLVSVPKHAF